MLFPPGVKMGLIKETKSNSLELTTWKKMSRRPCVTLKHDLKHMVIQKA